MAERIGGIARLFEGTKHEVRDDAFFRLAFDLAHEALVVLRGDAQLAARTRTAHGALASTAARIRPAGFCGRGDAAMAHGNLTLVQVFDAERIAERPGQFLEFEHLARV